MKAYSLDFRTQVVDALDKGKGTQKEIAALFGVSRTFINKLLRQRCETGSLVPKPHGGGRVARLDRQKQEIVRAYIARQNGATLAEVQAYMAHELRVIVSQATVSRVLKRLGFPRKKTRGVGARDET